jgi:4-amino-4-deoxy-L-arabinose transferase-like glycosyltransferase
MKESAWVVIFVGGVGFAAGLMVWLRHELRRRGQGTGQVAGEVRLWGAYSPLLTWLKAWFSAHRLSAMARPTLTLRSIPLEAWLLGAACGLALLGQLTLFFDEAHLTVGLLYYLLAISLFIWVGRRVEGNVLAPPFSAVALTRSAPSFALGLTSLALCLWTVQTVNLSTLTPLLGRAAVVTWAASIGLFVWSVLRVVAWRWPGPERWVAWARAHWPEVMGLILLGCLALWLRTYNLELQPYAMVNDEGEVGQEALRILAGLRTNFFETGWSAQPIWSFVPTAISVALFGHTTFAVRFVSAVQGTLSVICLYLLAREAFDRATAFLAAGFLVTLPFHIHFSRLGVCNGIDAFFSSLVIGLTYRALRRGQISGYLWAGLAAGLTIYSYLGSRLVAILAVGLLGYAVVRQRTYFRAHVRHLAVFAGALFLVATPMLVYYFRNPDLFLARLNAENILNNGWLKQAIAEQGSWQPLWSQFARSVLVFFFSGAPAGFYNSPMPYLVPLAAVFFLLGMGYVVWRLKEPRYMALFAWFWAVVVLGSTLTGGPPTSQRLIMTAPVLALITAIGLRKMFELWHKVGVMPVRLGEILSVGVLCVVGWQGVNFYFTDYAQGHYFEDQSNEITYEASRYAASLGLPYRMYLIGEPMTYVIFGNFKYLLPDMEVQDFNTVTPDSLAALPHDGGAFFVAIPSRRADLDLVASWAPGGRWQPVPRRYQPEQTLYFGYLLSPDQLAGR